MKMLAIQNAPKTWEGIKFQDPIIKTLLGSVKKDKIPNVLLFKGPSGVGKTTVAKILTATLFCENLKDSNPCGVCPSCLRIFGGVDNGGGVYYLSGSIDSGVDYYRSFMESLESGGTLWGSRKVVIIDEAHGLSKAALETLLIPLENPQNKDLYFILCTTEGLKIRENLKSRCLSFTFKKPNELDLATYLNSIIDKEGWRVPSSFRVEGVFSIIDYTKGNVRECINTLGQISLAGDFSEEHIRSIVGTLNTFQLYDVIDNIIQGKLKSSLMKLEEDVDVSDFFYKLLDAAYEVYKFKSGIALRNSYTETKFNTLFEKVTIESVAGLINTLIEIKKLCGYEISKTILIFTLLQRDRNVRAKFK